MKKNRQENEGIYLISGFLLVILVSFIFFFISNKFFSLRTKTYHSKFLKITINVPNNFSVKSQFNDIILTRQDNQIVISRNGTNYQNVNDYVDSLSKLNHFTLLNRENLIINNYNVVEGQISKQKVYFFYPAPWTIFSLSTSSPSLYVMLSQIAQSFQYTP